MAEYAFATREGLYFGIFDCVDYKLKESRDEIYIEGKWVSGVEEY